MPKAAKPAGPAKSPPARRAASPRRGLLKILAHCIIAVLLSACVATGYYFAQRDLETRIIPSDDPPRVVLLRRPPWMSDQVVEDLLRSLRPTTPRSVFDQKVLQTCARIVQNSPWVRHVNTVRRIYVNAPGDTIQVDCDFRVPAALVRWQDYYWLVDADAYKLPEQYTAAQAPEMLLDAQRRTQMRIIDGVRQPPVESGRQWDGADLRAGLELARLLHDQRYVDEILKIDVANFGGRLDPREAQLTLITRYGTEIRWGRPINARDAFVEVPPPRKLAALQQIYAKYGRVDANQPWLDVRFDQITYPQQADTSR